MNCCVPPNGTEATIGVTAMDVSVAAFAVRAPTPANRLSTMARATNKDRNFFIYVISFRDCLDEGCRIRPFGARMRAAGVPLVWTVPQKRPFEYTPRIRLT